MLSDMFFRQETRVAIVPTVAETFVAACDGVIDALPCVFGWTMLFIQCILLLRVPTNLSQFLHLH